MDKGIIIYGSKYGTTKSYALELSRRIKVDAISYKEVKSLSSYDTVIYLGGVYAEQILGLSKMLKANPLNSKQAFILVTVGLSDPKVDKTLERALAALKKILPQEIFEKSKIFNLHGGLDYNKLNFLYKLMMKAFYKNSIKNTSNNQSSEIVKMMESPNKKISFIDFESLNKIVEFINQK